MECIPGSYNQLGTSTVTRDCGGRGRERPFGRPPRTDPYVRNYRIGLLPRVRSVEAHVRIRLQDLGLGEPGIDGPPEGVAAAIVRKPTVSGLDLRGLPQDFGPERLTETLHCGE
jgi:hypothetical protein